MTHRNRSLHSIIHVSSHVPVGHQNTNSLSTKSRQPSPHSSLLPHPPPPNTLTSIYPLRILFTFTTQGSIWFSVVLLQDPRNFLYFLISSAMQLKQQWLCFIDNFWVIFGGNIFRLSKFIAFQEMEIKTFNLQKHLIILISLNHLIQAQMLKFLENVPATGVEPKRTIQLTCC